MFKKYFQGRKAVFFDLDGTLAETHHLWMQACSEVYANLGFEWRGYNFFKRPSLEEIWTSYVDYMGDDVGVPISQLVTQTKNKFLSLVLETSPEDLLTPGFWSFMNELKVEKGMKLGLVTNSDRSVVDVLLNHLNLSSSFGVVVCGDEVKKMKPAPDIYEKALKELGLKAKEAVCFEDSPAGVKAARKAGISVIGVRNTIYDEPDYPSGLLFVNDFTVFPGNLDRTRLEAAKASLEVSEEFADDIEGTDSAE